VHSLTDGSNEGIKPVPERNPGDFHKQSAQDDFIENLLLRDLVKSSGKLI